jgi:hypothetical protein
MGKILIAPHTEPVSGPLIFLGGPIQGAPDWQSEAIGILSVNEHIDIASPRRAIEKRSDFSESDYEAQVLWEHKYLEEAARRGVTLFWLPKPIQEISGRAYAQTSRFELGEALARHYLQKIPLVVGIEKGFSNERYVRITLKTKAPDVFIADTLEATCEKAIELCHTYR